VQQGAIPLHLKTNMKTSLIQQAIDEIKDRETQREQILARRAKNAVASIQPLMDLLEETFADDGLAGWEAPVCSPCTGAATMRYWIDGKYGSVYLNLHSSTPSQVDVHRGDRECPLKVNPNSEEGLRTLCMAIAERLTLSNSSDMVTATQK